MENKDLYKSPAMESDNQFLPQIMLAESRYNADINDAEEINWGEV